MSSKRRFFETKKYFIERSFVSQIPAEHWSLSLQIPLPWSSESKRDPKVFYFLFHGFCGFLPNRCENMTTRNVENQVDWIPVWLMYLAYTLASKAKYQVDCDNHNKLLEFHPIFPNFLTVMLFRLKS